jgi:hypothetical protein
LVPKRQRFYMLMLYCASLAAESDLKSEWHQTKEQQVITKHQLPLIKICVAVLLPYGLHTCSRSKM